MKKIFKISNLYIALWSAYKLLSSYQASRITAIMLLVLLLVSLFYTLKALSTFGTSNRFVKNLTLLLVLLLIYGVFDYISPIVTTLHGRPLSRMGNLLGILESFLPFYSFYYFSKSGKLTEKDLKIWTPILIIAFILSCIFQEANLLVEADSEETVNNAGYLVLSVLPFCLFYREKPLIMYSGILGIMFFVFTSYKRGAILLGVVCSLIILYFTMKNSSKNKKFLYFIVSAIAVFAIFRIVEYISESSYLFMARYQSTLDGNSSGRSDIWINNINAFLNRGSILNYFLGFGVHGTIYLTDYLAHNDWIEFLCDFGIIGVIFFFNYWHSLYKEIQLKPKGSSVQIILLIVFVIMFGKTLFSMSYNLIQFTSSCLLGYCVANGSNGTQRTSIYQ